LKPGDGREFPSPGRAVQPACAAYGCAAGQACRRVGNAAFSAQSINGGGNPDDHGHCSLQTAGEYRCGQSCRIVSGLGAEVPGSRRPGPQILSVRRRKPHRRRLLSLGKPRGRRAGLQRRMAQDDHRPLRRAARDQLFRNAGRGRQQPRQNYPGRGGIIAMADPVLWQFDARGVATVTLNRPEVNNAYDAGLINGVLAAMAELGQKPNLRVVVLRGNGKHFQAGADLKWINGVRPKSPEENEAVSRATFEAVQRLNTLPIPTVALVQGGCFGGGTGIISACDVVIAADNALFSITEVRWGLTAAIIIPQLCDSIGVRQVRRYALTGERFGAADARRIGLVHEVVPLAELESAGAKTVEQLLANGPEALAETKALALESSFGGMSVDDEVYARLVKMHSA